MTPQTVPLFASYRKTQFYMVIGWDADGDCVCVQLDRPVSTRSIIWDPDTHLRFFASEKAMREAATA